MTSRARLNRQTRRRLLLPQLSGLMLCCTPPAALATETPAVSEPFGAFVEATSLEQLAEMIVTDTKRVQPSSSVTQHFTVLRPTDLRRIPLENGNLSELLRYTSGQFVNVLSRNDANWGSHGGLGARYNSYLLDGMPIDSMIHPMVLDVEAIERVEVQKGPASVLYSSYLSQDFIGNETPLAGTTNFILKNQVDKAETRISAGAGSYNTARTAAYTQGRAGKLSYRLGGGEEYAHYTQVGDTGSWLQTTGGQYYRKEKLFLNLNYTLDRPDHSLSLFIHGTNHDGNLGRPNRNYSHHYDLWNLSYYNAFSPSWDLQLKLGDRRADRQYDNDNYPTNLNLANHEKTYQRVSLADLSLSHHHLQNSLLTLGMDRQQVRYETDITPTGGSTAPQNQADTVATAFFVQEKLQLDSWVLRAGARHNRIDSNFQLLGGAVPAANHAGWSKNLWSLGLRHDAGQGLAFYANMGSSFTAPTAKQVGGTVTLGSPLSGQIANPGLRPETGVGKDVGLDWQVQRNLNLNLRLFSNSVEDMIVTNVVSNLPSQVIAVNTGRARTQGVELDLRYLLSSSTTLFANTTLQHARIKDPVNADQNGSAIPFVPNQQVNAGLLTTLPGSVDLSLYGQWIGRYYDSSAQSSRLPYGQFAVLSARLQKSLYHGQGRDVRLTLDLNNLTDRRYAMPFAFRAPGFNGFVGVELVF